MLLTCFILLLFAYSLCSGRLERTPVTAPILFTLAGIVVPTVSGVKLDGVETHVFLQLAEIGLVLLLFTDASRTNLRMLNHIRTLPARLLGPGMLLTIALGGVAAMLVFPHFGLWEAGILAAILAPTDAGLGQVIVNSPRVPEKVREALSVEAGLNDGLAVPFLLFFIAMAEAGGGHDSLARLIGEQLGLGVAVGLGIGWGGGLLLRLARSAGWIAKPYVQIAVVALPVFCILLSEAVGASMFIAAFVAGLAAQRGCPDVGRRSVEFAEDWGQIVNLAVFFLFGMMIASAGLPPGARPWVYAVLSLTVVRVLPVFAALAGSGLDRRTVAFMGWFGPRGLASIVLGLVYLEHKLQLPGTEETRHAVMAAVLLSVFAHGLSAAPGIRLLARAAPA